MTLLSVAAFLLWLIALATTILNLRRVPKLAPRLPKHLPLVSVIVPARDEERAIERAVRRFLAQTWPSLEVIVVNDRSVDATGAILAAIGDPRLIVIDGEEPPAGWLGKPWALHQGSLRAKGELLLFVDADVMYAPDAVAAAAVLAAGEPDAPLRAVVCSAGGFAGDQPVAESPVDVFEAQFALNLRTAYLTLQATL
ncbi:MAG TPA: glycosyltransferase family A protein, partial [Thermoanaerobaculia bacterium]|nr:glycosyltransferase family A protein [Thermoanaerobaculia bacterium]